MKRPRVRLLFWNNGSINKDRLLSLCSAYRPPHYTSCVWPVYPLKIKRSCQVHCCATRSRDNKSQQLTITEEWTDDKVVSHIILDCRHIKVTVSFSFNADLASLHPPRVFACRKDWDVPMGGRHGARWWTNPKTSHAHIFITDSTDKHTPHLNLSHVNSIHPYLHSPFPVVTLPCLSWSLEIRHSFVFNKLPKTIYIHWTNEQLFIISEPPLSVFLIYTLSYRTVLAAVNHESVREVNTCLCEKKWRLLVSLFCSCVIRLYTLLSI